MKWSFDLYSATFTLLPLKNRLSKRSFQSYFMVIKSTCGEIGGAVERKRQTGINCPVATLAKYSFLVTRFYSWKARLGRHFIIRVVNHWFSCKFAARLTFITWNSSRNTESLLILKVKNTSECPPRFVQHGFIHKGVIQACPTFLVLRATFTRGNLFRVTNVFVT